MNEAVRTPRPEREEGDVARAADSILSDES